MSSQSGLTTRQFTREQVHLPAEFVVAAQHREQVRFNATSSAKDQHAITARTIDISVGGLGLSAHQFIPRKCEGVLRLFNPEPSGVGSDGQPIHEVLFEHVVKVRRVDLTGREPTYFIGLAFVDPEPDIDQRVAGVLDNVRTVESAGGIGDEANA